MDRWIDGRECLPLSNILYLSCSGDGKCLTCSGEQSVSGLANISPRMFTRKNAILICCGLEQWSSIIYIVVVVVI